MLGRALTTNYQICYPVRLKKLFRSSLNCKNFETIIPNLKSGVLGNIPPEIIESFGTDKANKAKQFIDTLGNISNYLRAAYYNLHYCYEYNLLKSESIIIENFEQKASFIFNKLIKKIFPNDTTASIKFAGRGDFGCVYQLSFLNNDGGKITHDKALKVYHSVVDREVGWRAVHGNFAESNFWTYIKHHAGHNLARTQFTRHYISDVKNAYALTEFIDSEIPKTTSSINVSELFAVNNFDEFGNKPILGKLYDVGLFYKDKGFTGDKMVIRYLKKLYYRSKKDLKQIYENLTAQSKNPKNEHRNKIELALSIFDERFPERKKWRE